MKTLPALLLIGLCACSTLPTSFTTDNMMKVHSGMTSNEIITMFGKPNTVSIMSCGKPPEEWHCTHWEYGEFPYDNASFFFYEENSVLKLNHFTVNKDTSL